MPRDVINAADGVKILSFTDAVRLALEEDRPTLQIRARLRVEDALDEYFEARRVSSTSESIYRDRVAAEAFIVPAAHEKPASGLSEPQKRRLRHSLRGKFIADLTTADLRRWRDSLVANTKDSDERRRAKSSANRVWSVLRAALNLAFQNERVSDDRAWRRLTPFKSVDQPQTRFLRIEECRRLIAAADVALRPLVEGCLFTGLRLGELLALAAADVGEGHVTVRHSKTGKSRRVPLNREGTEFFRNLIEGKSPGARLFSFPTLKAGPIRLMASFLYSIYRHTASSTLA